MIKVSKVWFRIKKRFGICKIEDREKGKKERERRKKAKFPELYTVEVKVK